MDLEPHHVPPDPVIIELAALNAPTGLVYPDLATSLGDLDFLYRVAAGSYGTTLTRLQGPIWPQPRPRFVKLGYGSPLELQFLADLQTVLTGVGAGTGVVGFAALLRWAWGIDLDFRSRRAKGYAEIARHQADAAVARADAEEAEVRRLVAVKAIEASSRQDEEARNVARANRPSSAAPVDTRTVDEIAGKVHLSPQRELQPVANQEARLIRVVNGRGRIRRRDEALRALAGRLVAVHRRSWLFREARGSLRDPTPEERSALGLPRSGGRPSWPDERDY